MDDFANDSVVDAGGYVSFETLTPKILITGKRNAALRSMPANAPTQSTKRPEINSKNQTSSKKKVEIIPNPSGTQNIPSKMARPEKFKFILDANNVVSFYGRENFLSNFFEAQFSVEQHRYFSVEHFYEAAKLLAVLGRAAAVQLQNVRDPIAAKSISRRLISEAKVDRKRVEQWRRDEGVEVVKYALTQKFAPGTELAQKLIATGMALLAQANPYDDLWAVNMSEKDFGDWMKKNDKMAIYLPAVAINSKTIDSLPVLGRNGKNLLGYLLMQLRGTLQKREQNLASPHRLALIEEEARPSGADGGVQTSEPIDDVVILASDERFDEIGRKLAEINMRDQCMDPHVSLEGGNSQSGD